MSDYSILANQVAQLTQRLNDIQAQGKKIDELPDQNPLEPGSLIHVSNSGTSEKVIIQQILDAAISYKQNELISASVNVTDDNEITVSAGAKWLINNVEYSNLSDSVFSIPYAETGFTRNDVLYGNENNNILRLAGPETEGISPVPNVPLNTVLISIINVTDSNVGSEEPPQQDSNIITKTTISEIRSYNGTLSNTNFYTTDKNQEGFWYYDIADTTSIDNTGTVLVTTDGKRLKRIVGDYHNVKWFGAKGDNSTDDTASIQATINEVDKQGGGKVFIPNGIYIIGGALNTSSNSQLYIPVSKFNEAKRNHITIFGESKPNLIPVGGGLSQAVNVVMSNKNVILKSTITTHSAKSTIIGTALANDGSFNETFLSVEQIACQILNNPTGTGPVIGGISYKNGGGLNCKYITVYIDTPGFSSVLPANDVSGIEGPDNSSETFNTLENTLVIGLRNGYVLGEHVALYGTVAAMTCLNAFNFKDGYHSSTALRGASYWCSVDIKISGFCTLNNFNIDVEWQQVGKWFDSTYTISDPSSLAYGNVNYCIIRANFGKDQSKLSTEGASNLFATSQDGYAITKTNPIFSLNSASNGSNIFKFKKAKIDKWAWGTDILGDGEANFWLYDYANSIVRLFGLPNGNIRIGSDAQTSDATSSLTLFANRNVVCNGSFQAQSVIKNGGLGNQTLQADGSVVIIRDRVLTSSATTITLPTNARTIYYVYKGASNVTWNLPTVVSSSDIRYIIINKSATGTITLPSGTNEIWDSGTLQSSTTCAPGSTMEIYNDSENFVIL